MTDVPLYKSLLPLDRWLITGVIMAAALMEIIDTTIINVALPHMQGSLGASSDEITWTLTSYIVSAAICMPLTGYLSDRLGRKKYLILSIASFTVVSALCGASTSITEIVFFRLLQGIFGAGLVPLSQAILADIFPPEERGKAMAIWGIGVMVGPILGPTLGGYLTDILNWRWTFYVNVPVGIFTLLLANVLPNTQIRNRQTDWIGLILISLAIGGLQYVLDRGNQADWFNSSSICLVSYITITAFLGFILHNIHAKQQPIFNLAIFKDKNFTISSIILSIFCLAMYGMTVIQPMMMEGFLNYPALTTGLMLAPRGISGMISMIIVGKLITRVDPRALIVTGILINVLSMWIATHYSLDVSTTWLIWPMFIQGFGLGMVFVPLSTIAYATLPAHLRTEAAGLYNLLRTLGGSIGISIVITLFTRRTQVFWHTLGGAVQTYNPALSHYLNPLNLQSTDALSAVILSEELYRQAAMISFVNIFAFIMGCFLLMIPLIGLLEKNKPSTPIEIADH